MVRSESQRDLGLSHIFADQVFFCNLNVLFQVMLVECGRILGCFVHHCKLCHFYPRCHKQVSKVSELGRILERMPEGDIACVNLELGPPFADMKGKVRRRETLLYVVKPRAGLLDLGYEEFLDSLGLTFIGACR